MGNPTMTCESPILTNNETGWRYCGKPAKYVTLPGLAPFTGCEDCEKQAIANAELRAVVARMAGAKR